MRRPSRSSTRLLLLAFLATSLPAQTANAQAAPFQGVELNLFRPSPYPDGGITTDTAQRSYQWGYSAQLMFHYAVNPLIWRYPDNTQSIAVRDQLLGHVMAHVSFFPWLQAAIDLPISLAFGTVDLRGLAPAPASTALGDLRLSVKALFLDQNRHFINMGLAADVAFPTSGGQAYIGSTHVSGAPRLIISRRFGRVELAANLGARLRVGQEVLGAFAASQLHYGGMLRWNLPWRTGPVSYELIGELWGLTAAARPFSREAENLLEWTVATRLGFFDNLYVTLGLGGGFLPGYGSPDLRVFLGVAWAPRLSDRDFDGIPDKDDACPDDPETFNGIDDDDGCPEIDRDRDGIIDILDQCPNRPETFNGFEDDDGCPDRTRARRAKCLEAMGKVRDAESGEEPDDKPEDCPDPEPLKAASVPVAPPEDDRDRDGIVNAEDKCPDEPETINGNNDEDGCPDEGKGVTVFLSKQKIQILEKINFETASAVIKPESYRILDEVSAQLRAHPEVKLLRIEGHTDSVGSDQYNQHLSQARADSVRRYMMEKGRVDKDRLIAKGYGESRPIASNASDRGRAQNRRVEFVILEQDEGD